MKLKKHKNKIFTIIFIIFTIGAIIWSLSDDSYEEPKETTDATIKVEEKKEEKEEDTKVIVDIKGEVVNPGVYELTSQNNVNDAINTAGGLTNKSDTSNINLSKKLEDEMVIIVYSKAEIQKMKAEATLVCPQVNSACVTENDEKAKLTSDSNSNGQVNINSASLEELLTLDGIGEAKAKAIIEYREKTKFNAIEDIKNVSGIGESLFEKIKDRITV